MQNTNEYLSEREAGIYLGTPDKPIPPATMRWWRCKGRGPAYFKHWRSVIYARRDLDAFREAGRHDPEAV